MVSKPSSQHWIKTYKQFDKKDWTTLFSRNKKQPVFTMTKQKAERI